MNLPVSRLFRRVSPKFRLDFRGGKFHIPTVIEPETCAVVIPCLNEAASISALVADVRRRHFAVFVVNDGSSDGTAELAERAGATVLRHARNLGKGAALQTGLEHARSCGFDWAATLDGDGQHAPEDVPVLLRCADSTGATMVVGNRMGQADKMPWVRRRVNRLMSRIISRKAGKILPDTQSGFRLIHLPTWEALSFQTRGFEVESEMLLAFVAAGERVEFVPVAVRPSGRASHIVPVRDTVRWLRWWKKFHRSGVRPMAAQPEPVNLKTELIRTS